jgi:hypothetical protein
MTIELTFQGTFCKQKNWAPANPQIESNADRIRLFIGKPL